MENSSVNQPDLVTEVSRIYDRYELALVTNDVPVLQELFWNSPLAVRYGATENLYGYDEIEKFRKERPAVNLAREVVRKEIVTFGADTAVVNLEFKRTVNGTVRLGRQSQTWRKFGEGWKIVSAHVSLLPA